MKISEAMTKHPTYIDPQTTLQDAANIMREYDFGFLPIGENDRLVGVVTDRDITVRGTAQGKDPSHVTVDEVMSDHVYYCFEEDEVEKAAHNMGDLQVRRLIVLDKNKRLQGIVSIGDIATRNHDDFLSGDTIEHISEH